MKQTLLLSGILFLFVISFAEAQKTEAEDGQLSGTTIATEITGYSGDGYVTGFDADNDAVSMIINVSAEGLYDLWVGYAAPSGEKTNDIYVNGIFAGNQIFALSTTFTESLFGKVTLKKGDNTIKIVKNWGYFDVDYIRVEPTQPNDIDNFSETLINPDASEEAKILYQYIKDLYGHRIISGQQSYEGTDLELDYIMEHTGRLPAIKGFDLIDYSPSRVAHGTTSQQTQQAIDWWDKGGIVALMWHWNAPKDLLDTDDAPWWSGFYTYATTFDLSIAMNDQNSEEYQLIIRDIDAIADQLKQLKDSNTPVIWRPLHEAEGAWFWWGAQGPAACKWLWKLMYDRLTNYHELNNLIWVWTGTNSDAAMDWYPGDDYVDIVGADIYLDNKNYSASFSLFDDLAGIHDGKKIITMSETGTIPDAEDLDDQKARWSWFCTWSGDFILDPSVNDVAHINAVYNDEYVITFDELPDFSNYISPEFPDEEVITSLAEDIVPVSLYPNPAADHLHLIIHHPQDISSLTLYNLQGQIVKSLDHENIRAEMTLDVSSIPGGLYIVRVISTKGIHTYKLRKI